MWPWKLPLATELKFSLSTRIKGRNIITINIDVISLVNDVNNRQVPDLSIFTKRTHYKINPENARIKIKDRIPSGSSYFLPLPQSHLHFKSCYQQDADRNHKYLSKTEIYTRKRALLKDGSTKWADEQTSRSSMRGWWMSWESLRTNFKWQIF